VSGARELERTVRREGGDARLRCLALIHAAASVGRFDAVHDLLALAVGLGVPAARLREALLQVVAYGGFPRAIEGLRLLARSGAERAPPGPPDPVVREQGRAVFDAIYGRHADEVLARLDALGTGFSHWVIEDAYARVLARPGLTIAERELLAVAALCLMALPAPLESHVRGALLNGSTAPAVADILHSCRVLADPDAERVLERALERLSKRTPTDHE
jgi:4-carboxymuconolactone decarboxylase